MMDRQRGKIVYECDTCDAVFETESSELDEARMMLEAEGWRTYRLGDQWCHSCEKCTARQR